MLQCFRNILDVLFMPYHRRRKGECLLFVWCFCGLNLMLFEAVNKDFAPFSAKHDVSLSSASTEPCSPVDVITDIHEDKCGILLCLSKSWNML